MSDITFDTLKYAKKLKEAGFTEQQAEIQAETMKHQNDVMQDFIDEKLATKDDLKQLEERLTYKLTIRFGSMMVSGIAFLSALIVILKVF